MKKFCTLLVFCFAILLVAKASNDYFLSPDTVTTVIIIHDISSEDQPRMPEMNQLLFSGYEIEPSNCIFLSSNKAVQAIVKIENVSTGCTTQYYTLISSTPVSLGLLGSGAYHLTISLPSNDTYFSDFDTF